MPVTNVNAMQPRGQCNCLGDGNVALRVKCTGTVSFHDAYFLGITNAIRKPLIRSDVSKLSIYIGIADFKILQIVRGLHSNSTTEETYRTD